MARLQQHAPDVWTAEQDLRLLAHDFGARMTVVRLADGGLWLHSPIRPDPELRAELDALGPVRHVIGPNCFHHLWLGEFAAAYPHAQVWLAPGLCNKRKDLAASHELNDTPPTSWRGQLDQHLVGGAGMINEVVFFHRASRTAIFTDYVGNVPRQRGFWGRVYGWLNQLDGQPGLSAAVKLTTRDKAACRASMQHILAWQPARILYTHGPLVAGDGTAQLKHAWRAIL